MCATVPTMTTDTVPAAGLAPTGRMSRRDAAQRLGVTEHTIDRYVAAGTLPAIRSTVGRRTWILSTDVERVRAAREGLDS